MDTTHNLLDILNLAYIKNKIYPYLGWTFHWLKNTPTPLDLRREKTERQPGA